jgi:hypothetical protein
MVRAVVILAAGIAVVAAGSLQAGVASPSAQSASRVIDQTVLCSIAPHGGIRELNLLGKSGVRNPRDEFALPVASLHNGNLSVPPLAWISASPGSMRASIGYSTDFCRPYSRAVALAPSGLDGARAGLIMERWECAAPRRVVIRFRAEFRRPVSLRRSEGQRRATGLIRTSSIVARTQTGKALANANVMDSGATRLFHAGSCFPG